MMFRDNPPYGLAGYEYQNGLFDIVNARRLLSTYPAMGRMEGMYRNGQYANSDVFALLRKAYDVLNETSDRSQSLLLIYQALEVARATDNRVLRAHVTQCSEYVKRI